MACESKCAKNCFQDWISCGPYNSIITVNTGLDAGEYTAILTDKFDHKYEIHVTVDDSGRFEININDLPEGLFNEFGGVITLELMKNNCEKIKIPILDGYDYIDSDCIEISVKGGTMEKTNIGCSFDVLGPELITNGGFTGNANGWTLGSSWLYDTNKVTFSFLPDGIQELTQGGLLTQGGHYRVSFNISGDRGYVVATLNEGTHGVFNAGSGNVTFDGVWSGLNGFIIVFMPSAMFDGSITNVSIKEIL